MSNHSAVLAIGLAAAACWGCGKDHPNGDAGDAGGGNEGGRRGAGTAKPPPPAVTGLGPRDVALDLALNDGTSEQALRGFPLLVLGVAALTQEVSEPIELDPAEVGLRVTDEGGEVQAWPLVQLSSLPSELALDASLERVQAWWALTAEEAAELRPGSYQVQLIWGERGSPPLALEVVDAPEELELAERLKLAKLQAQHALLEGDPPRALEAAQAGLAEQPDDVGLLLWQAHAHEADGDLDAAFESVQLALEQHELQHPDASRPPFTLLEARRQLLDQMLEAVAP